MRYRLRSCGECLLTGVVLGVLFLGIASTARPADRLQRKTTAEISDVSYVGRTPAMGISASVIAGRHRRAGMTTFGWTVCWSGAETKCLDVVLEWRARRRRPE